MFFLTWFRNNSVWFSPDNGSQFWGVETGFNIVRMISPDIRWDVLHVACLSGTISVTVGNLRQGCRQISPVKKRIAVPIFLNSVSRSHERTFDSSNMSVTSLITSSDHSLQTFLIGSIEILLESFTLLDRGKFHIIWELHVTWEVDTIKFLNPAISHVRVL
jgi:hypothetical protein